MNLMIMNYLIDFLFTINRSKVTQMLINFSVSLWIMVFFCLRCLSTVRSSCGNCCLSSFCVFLPTLTYKDCLSLNFRKSLPSNISKESNHYFQSKFVLIMKKVYLKILTFNFLSFCWFWELVRFFDEFICSTRRGFWFPHGFSTIPFWKVRYFWLF